MSNVVYLVSGLPSLSFGNRAPISLNEFMQDAKAQLSKADYSRLKSIDIKQLSKVKGMGRLKMVSELFEELETQKREFRLTRNQANTPDISTSHSYPLGKNPLELELYFMKQLWDMLDEVDVTEQFTITEVFVYKLKLQIQERLDSFNPIKGLEILNKVVQRTSEKMET